MTPAGAGRSAAEGLVVAGRINKPVSLARLHDELLAALTGEPSGHVAAGARQERGLSRRESLRILLADDNPVNQRVARRLLSLMGYEADVAADGAEAVEAVRRRRYDVVLLDVQMPTMGGWSARVESARRWERAAGRD